MASQYTIDVNEANFEFEVIAFSQNTPVLVDFWAPWCQPCKILTPLLEELINGSEGAFRLARINVDENPLLAMRYGVRTIPTVKAIKSGQVVAEFTGLQPQDRLRAFLEQLLPPTQLALNLEKGYSLLGQHAWGEAGEVFEELRQQNPQNPVVLLGLIRAQLAQGRHKIPAELIREFPASREYASAERLKPFADMLNRYAAQDLPEDDDLDLIFNGAMRLASRGNLEGAMDGLIEVLRDRKGYRSGRARIIYLAILELYAPEDATARQYRNELSALLF